MQPGARVGGDVASRTAPTATRGTVQGHVEKLDVDSLFAGFVVVILAVLWVAVTLSILILGVLFVWLFPRAADAVVVAGRRFWASFFLGLLLGVVLPVFGIVVMASVVGIPLGVAVLGALAVLGPLGYVASALIFGRLMVHRSGTGGRLGAFFAGFGILRFAALVPGLGLVIGFFVSTYGLGAVIIAGWRGARRPLGKAEEELPEYTATPELLVGEPLLIDTFGRPPARTARARKTPSRKAPAKKKATGAKKSRGTRSTGTRSRAAAARKSGPRKATAKKRSNRGGSQRRKNTTKKRATRAKAAPRKGSVNSTRKRASGTKRTTKKRASTRKRSTANKRTTTNKHAATSRRATTSKRATASKRATTSKRASTNTSRTAKKRGAKKSSARKATPRRPRATSPRLIP